MTGYSLKNIESITKKVKKNCPNRVYYKHNFELKPWAEAGILRSNEKNAFDLVVLNLNRNEFLRWYAFNQDGSHFELTISIISLYPDVQRPNYESNWRSAQARLVYESKMKNVRYIYEHEQLLDYSKKWKQNNHEATSVYRIGSITIDVNIPFAQTRILFNGKLRKIRVVNENQENSGINSNQNYDSNELVSMKIDCSVNSIADKFDNSSMFSSKFLAKQIFEYSIPENSSPESVIKSALDDRIDQSVMIRAEIEDLDNTKSIELLWGSKMHRFIEPRFELTNKSISYPVESLLIWSEYGHYINLRRPVGQPNFLQGNANCGFDYASYIYGANCNLPDAAFETTLARLASFSNIPPGTKITIIIYKSKQVVIEFPEGVNQGNAKHYDPIKVVVDGIDGLAMCRCDNFGEMVKKAQTKLLALDIHSQSTYSLAQEYLLGGKGNSLVALSFLTKASSGVDLCRTIVDPDCSFGCSSIHVPRGIIVSCLSYQLWLSSTPLIASTLSELDRVRRSLAAQHFCANPLSDKYLTMASHEQQLRGQCEKTNQILLSCPLPMDVKQQIHIQLVSLFGLNEIANVSENFDDPAQDSKDGTNGRLFAVRSSAMGEDGIETSAAGQMKTILDARGFDAICRAVVACWASQFEYQAITYKSQNAQLFNWPMAVVIQELINCDFAGVSATCNPINGNVDELEITANPGLGEGVVAGKQTDTLRVSLNKVLNWDEQAGCYKGQLRLSHSSDCIEKVACGDKGPCISDGHTLALGNLLIWLRGCFESKEREVEWGITLDPENLNDDKKKSDNQSTSASSYCSTLSNLSQLCQLASIDEKKSFRIHLFQSRPLTNLSRPGTLYLTHELDSAVGSPLEIMSRANLAEVLPGSSCAMTQTHMFQIIHATSIKKPYERNHTCELYGQVGLSNCGRLTMIVLSSADTMLELFGNRETVRDAVEIMIGFDELEQISEERLQTFFKLRRHPAQRHQTNSLTKLAFGDSGYIFTKDLLLRKDLRNNPLLNNRTPIERLIQIIEHSDTQLNETLAELSIKGKKTNLKHIGKKVSQEEYQQRLLTSRLKHYNSLALKREPVDETFKMIREKTLQMYNDLQNCIDLLHNSWVNHLRGTFVSMFLNYLCIYILGIQDQYKQIEDEKERRTKIFNDFSVLIRDKNSNTTESANISRVLDRIINSLASEGMLRQAQDMNHKELYDKLSNESNKSDSALEFRRFMDLNGHRCFRELDYSSITWADDPSFIFKSLSNRLKLHSLDTPTTETIKPPNKGQDIDQVLVGVTKRRTILVNYAIPRARKAVARREVTKSTLIKAMDVYRKAFRYLGALLCLEGRLPEVDLIYHITVQELNDIVNATDSNRADLSRIIYKARRRKQIGRTIDDITFRRPTLSYNEIIDSIKNAIEPTDIDIGHQLSSTSSDTVVKGMTSCTGLVNGRACVVKNLDEMDQLEPNDILITHSIDVSWTVYFFKISGIVTEYGGIVSHGAVVAREYGIPTLCTAIGACSKFKTGQLVTLDANRGICYLSPESPEGNPAALD